MAELGVGSLPHVRLHLVPITGAVPHLLAVHANRQDALQGAHLRQRRIPLGEGQYALVDAADYEALNRYNWRFYNGYAARQERRKTIYMHRQIMQPPDGMVVDHVNHNKLDNRRINLRPCTRRENIHNQAAKSTSALPFKGVEYCPDRNKCFARIRIDGQRRWLGTVYGRRRRDHHG